VIRNLAERRSALGTDKTKNKPRVAHEPCAVKNKPPVNQEPRSAHGRAVNDTSGWHRSSAWVLQNKRKRYLPISDNSRHPYLSLGKHSKGRMRQLFMQRSEDLLRSQSTVMGFCFVYIWQAWNKTIEEIPTVNCYLVFIVVFVTRTKINQVEKVMQSCIAIWTEKIGCIPIKTLTFHSLAGCISFHSSC